MVKDYVAEGGLPGWPPWVRLSDEEANVKPALKLVEETFDRLQRAKGISSRTDIERAVIEELARRYSPKEAEDFARKVEAEWFYQHENGYPDSTRPVEARPGPHGSPGHVCWDWVVTWPELTPIPDTNDLGLDQASKDSRAQCASGSP
jgi:hypothetical protein